MNDNVTTLQMHPTLLSRISKFGLYAITDESPQDVLLDNVKKSMIGGIGMLQLRTKNNVNNNEKPAKELLDLCNQNQIPFIVNDNIELAKKINASGVHLGKNDESIALAKMILGKNAIIGASCYNNIDLALTLEKQGASYVAFGSMFSSTTKPNATQCDLAIISEAKKRLTIPIVAIGGITVNNAKPIFKAGADFCAVINGLFSSKNISETAKQFNQLKFIK